jgi:hypothetical protein
VRAWLCVPCAGKVIRELSRSTRLPPGRVALTAAAAIRRTEARQRASIRKQ